MVEDLINGGSLRYAIHQRLQEPSEGIRRWPQGGFLDGNVFDLGRLIPAMALPKEHVEAVAEDAANCVKAAAERLESGLPQKAHGLPQKAQNEVGVLMRQQTLLSGLHTTALMWLNAMLVQQRLFLQESPAVKAGPLTTCTDLSDQIRVWKDILAENWRSIFKPAVQALELARQHSPAAAQEAIRVLTQAVESIETAPLGMHMNVGAELYPKLSDDRKEAAAFYTQSATAELLAALTIRRRDLTADQWAGDVFANHRLADLACGTGTLLRAGYRRIEALHNHSNTQLGKDSKNGGGYCMSRRWSAVLLGPT